MFYTIKAVHPLPQQQLSVQFTNGTTKLYNCAPLIATHLAFAPLANPQLFQAVTVDAGGYGVVWSDTIDLSCDELWTNGQTQVTPFDGLMSFRDASTLWGLSESALRKAIAYGKIVAGVDARKYGKQWIITRAAMEREYGSPTA
jgi:hypothetical protein